MRELRLSNRKSPIPAEVGRTRDVTFFPAFTVDLFTLQAFILYTQFQATDCIPTVQN
jgi:hypothetical protein